MHAHSYRADEILMLLRVADEFGFKIATLQHVLEGYIDCDVDAREFRAHPPEHRLWGGLEPLTDQSLAAIRFSSSP